MRFSLVLLLPRTAVPGAGARPPAPRRARAPAASTPPAHEADARFGRPFSGRSFSRLASRCAARHAGSFRNFAAPARTDDRRTNDATCGPQAWLTGSLHDARRGNAERTLTALADPSPRDPYRHALAMRPSLRAGLWFLILLFWLHVQKMVKNAQKGSFF